MQNQSHETFNQGKESKKRRNANFPKILFLFRWLAELLNPNDMNATLCSLFRRLLPRQMPWIPKRCKGDEKKHSQNHAHTHTVHNIMLIKSWVRAYECTRTRWDHGGKQKPIRLRYYDNVVGDMIQQFIKQMCLVTRLLSLLPQHENDKKRRTSNPIGAKKMETDEQIACSYRKIKTLLENFSIPAIRQFGVLLLSLSLLLVLFKVESNRECWSWCYRSAIKRQQLLRFCHRKCWF